MLIYSALYPLQAATRPLWLDKSAHCCRLGRGLPDLRRDNQSWHPIFFTVKQSAMNKLDVPSGAGAPQSRASAERLYAKERSLSEGVPISGDSCRGETFDGYGLGR